MERPKHLTLDGTEPTGRPQVDVEEVGGSARGAWNDVVERSPHGTPFHQFEFLEAIDRHVDAELRALVGRDGGEPIGVFPLFRWRPARFVDVVFSPPPRMGLYMLGPAVLDGDDPEGVVDRNRQFVDGCLDWLESELGPWYVHVETSRGYADVRPFVWRDHDVTPRYTYLVDLDHDEEDLFMSFSSDARRNVRKCRDGDSNCAVRVGDTDGIREIVASVNERYAEQGEEFALDPAFVTDLYEALPEGQVRPYVTTVDGEFAGGMVAFEYGDTIYRWQGGAVPDVELPVNDFLDWYIMRDAMDRGVRWYDLVGANTERLCEYKAKFDPTLADYYSLTAGNRVMRTGIRLFDESSVQFQKTFMGD